MTQLQTIKIKQSTNGKATHLEVPISAVGRFFEALSDEEKETLEIQLDPKWSKTLNRRLKDYLKNPKKALEDALTLEDLNL